MKWDVKHDRAKKVIDHFLDNAGYWQESEYLVENLSEEEKQLVSEEVELMIASIRKRYKLKERLPEVIEEKSTERDKTVEMEASEVKKEEKPKRGRKASTGEKKEPTRKTKTKKSDKEAKENV